jgi:hypothetical protein
VEICIANEEIWVQQELVPNKYPHQSNQNSTFNIDGNFIVALISIFSSLDLWFKTLTHAPSSSLELEAHHL